MTDITNKSSTLDNTRSQMRKGTLEFMVLKIIARQPTYAADIIDVLKRAEIIVVEGTLYPLLSRLRTAELVSYTWQESLTGPPKKVYAVTPHGHEFLDGLDETWEKINQCLKSLSK